LKNALSFQREADNVLRNGGAILLGHDVSISEWFATSAFYVALTRYASQTQLDCLKRLLAALGASMPRCKQIDQGVELELTSTATRQQLFSSAWCFLSADRDSLGRALIESGTSRQGINPGKRPVPGPLVEIVDALPDRARAGRKATTLRTSGPKGDRSIAAKMARLERRLSVID